MKKGRTIKDYLVLAAKGMGMGAADVVPGVSGGTIAFITGIYEELLDSIKSINLEALKVLRSNGLGAFWKAINGNFLLALFAGILISILSLAKLISYLLDTYPIMLWAFFFGLIIGSAIIVGRQIKKWDLSKGSTLAAGIIAAWFITTLTRVNTPEALWFVFLAGAIAICAMILPGISGSFILLVLGKYKFILGAVKEMDITVLITFMLGCLTGLLAFSRVLSWAFHKYHDHTIALLTGFMLGSLNKVWPWKHTLEFYTDRHGDLQPLAQKNVLPNAFEELTGDANFLLPAILCLVAGFATVVLLERFGAKQA